MRSKGQKMFGQALKRAVVATGAAALIMGLGVSAASATPVPFTWKPSGSTPPLSIPGAAFTADSFDLADFAHIHLAPTGAFTEQGVQIGRQHCLDPRAERGWKPTRWIQIPNLRDIQRNWQHK